MISGVLKNTAREILADKNIPWEDLRNTSVLITGATGFVGGALIAALAAANREYGLQIKLIGHGRNALRGEELCRECRMEFISGNIQTAIPEETLPWALDYIFHCASVTRSADMVARPADLMSTAADGTKTVLNLARGKCPRSVVYLSSMEVYGQIEHGEVRENDLGYLDLRNPRSSYPESKRFCEMLCAAYAVQYGVPVKIARLAQTFGPGVSKGDTRVFAQFARGAMEHRDIELHTAGTSKGNYCHTSDAVRGLLTVLLKGNNGEAYNVANPSESITIREMAELVASRIGGGKIRALVHIPEDIKRCGYAADTGFTLNADKLGALGWAPKHSLADMYGDMIADWQAQH